MAIYFLDNDGDWASTDNSQIVKVEEMLQRMQTWRGEKQFDATDGVDYMSVLNKQALLRPQIEDIADEYRAYFDTVIDSVEDSDEVIAVKMHIVLKSGQSVARAIYV